MEDSQIILRMALVAALLILLGLEIGDGLASVSFHDPAWECTSVKLVNNTLPHKEECTQYTRKVMP